MKQGATRYISIMMATLLLLITCSQGANAAKAPQKTKIVTFNKASLTQGTFGFANQDGTKLLVDYPQEKELKWSQLKIAVGHHGQRLAIKFKGKQKAKNADNGRQTAYNFDNLGGLIYEVVDGKAEPNETYFIVKDNSLSDQMLLELTSVHKEKINKKMKSDITKLKKRTVKNLYPLENIEDFGKLYLVEFSAKGKDRLASLALRTSKGWVFMDYPAKFSDNSAWRVDDGGTITPDMFSFTFATRTEQGFIIGVQWMGSEGESTSFLEFKKGKFTQLDISYSRYMMPI